MCLLCHNYPVTCKYGNIRKNDQIISNDVYIFYIIYTVIFTKYIYISNMWEIYNPSCKSLQGIEVKRQPTKACPAVSILASKRLRRGAVTSFFPWGIGEKKTTSTVENVSNGFQLVSNLTITFWPIMTYLNVSQPSGCGLIYFLLHGERCWHPTISVNVETAIGGGHRQAEEVTGNVIGLWWIHSLLCQQLLEMHNVCFMSLLLLLRFGPTFHWNFQPASW